jgi:hypothetical protein
VPSFRLNQPLCTVLAKIEMRPAAPEVIFRRLLLAVALSCSAALWAAEEAEFGSESSVSTTTEERSMRKAISEIESRQGAYAAELPEQMLSLGLSLQQQERHGEAIAVFKRGVHLARINNGLYSAEQIPLLQGEIKSAIALREYSQVDELQQYLYRVQLRGLAGGEERANALIQQAAWQFNAYQLRLGEPQGEERLLTMWDLYRQAWNDLLETEGETSPKLLPPLYGMLRTQYLISEFQTNNDGVGNSFSSNYGSSNANRFYAYRTQNYDLGRSVISSIYNIQRVNYGEESDGAIDTLVSMGDWALWYDKREDATESYRHALAELAPPDGAQEVERRLLAEPVPLPDIKGLRRLPPTVGAELGNILVEFGVDSRGKVVDLERLDTNEDMDSTAIRLMRALRGTKFRPRFEAGEPVETNELVRAYDIKPKK